MKSKIETLLEIEGYDNLDEFINEKAFDSIVPGICINEGCNATYEYEPDQDQGWCGECETKTVQSALILLGVI